jgi:hypothetical protein
MTGCYCRRFRSYQGRSASLDEKAILQSTIGRILYQEWDPIGVSAAAPEDEYDSYIGPVYRILVGNRSEQELIELLFHIERESIGLSCTSPDRLRPVARRLLGLDVNL